MPLSLGQINTGRCFCLNRGRRAHTFPPTTVSLYPKSVDRFGNSFLIAFQFVSQTIRTRIWEITSLSVNLWMECLQCSGAGPRLFYDVPRRNNCDPVNSRPLFVFYFQHPKWHSIFEVVLIAGNRSRPSFNGWLRGKFLLQKKKLLNGLESQSFIDVTVTKHY